MNLVREYFRLFEKEDLLDERRDGRASIGAAGPRGRSSMC